MPISFFFEIYETTLVNQKTPSIKTDHNLKSLELESIDFFVRLMGILGMPRSVGEIYGLLYFSESPLSMNQISTRLEISIGSAGQGLKTLKALKAINSTYIPGDRRDHYTAETEFRKLFSSFINDEIMPHLQSAKDRISRMQNSLSDEKKQEQFYIIRLEKLKKLTKTASRLFPTLSGLLKL